MLQLGQITALGTVVFTAVLLLQNIVAMARLSRGKYSREKADTAGTAAARAAADSTATAEIVAQAKVAKVNATNAKATFIRARSSVVTQAIVWAAGVLAVYVADWAGLSNEFTIGSLHLAALGVGAKIVLGLMASSTLSVINQIKKALDNTDSARTSPLFGDPTLPPKPTVS
jgi:hypothetical protein